MLRLIESGSAHRPAAGQRLVPTLRSRPRAGGRAAVATPGVAGCQPARTALVKTLIERLDQPMAVPAAPLPSGNIHVVYLKNADAVKLAATLRAALSGEVRSTPAPAANTTGAGRRPARRAASSAAQSTTGGQIQADAATNSLIITAPEPQYRQLRAVIDQLDAARPGCSSKAHRRGQCRQKRELSVQ